jgi:hypothetical protein
MLMRTHIMVGLAAAALVSMGSQAAQTPPQPAAEMAQLAYFEGSWSCTGQVNESPFGPAGKVTSTADIRKDLGGFWQSGTIKGTMANMPPFEGRFHATYDPGAKQFVMLWVDSMGGWSRSMAAGWKGDTIVYEGESHMGPQSMTTRDSFTRSGAGSMKHAWEAQIDGKWTPLGEETCTKK